jgi:tetratricopeptide (TPR) repeat protein
LARSYVGIKQHDEAKDLFLLIVHENPRTDISAEAYFYLAEMYFKDLKDYQTAIENYNKVRQEKPTSPFVSTALTKSAIASQIVQYRSAGKDVNVLDLADQQFKLAEYYVFELDFPDSALVIYDEIIANQSILQNSIDSLYTSSILLKSELIQQYPYFNEQRDTIQFVIKKVQKDTLISDSTRTEVVQKLQNFQTQQAQYEMIRKNLNDFSEEVVPFAYFSKIYIYHKLKADSLKAQEMLSSLKKNFPENKYTYASKQLLNGEKVEFTTPLRMRQIEFYHETVQAIEQDPAESISQLKTIINDENHPYFQESLYLLGYVYYFQLADSTSAKTYIDSLIQIQDYKEPLIRKVASFYDGNSFKEVSSLNSLEKYKEKEPEEEEKTEPTEEEVSTEDKK